jgi:hypothetical protein
MTFSNPQLRNLDLQPLVLEAISPIKTGSPSSHWHGSNGSWNCTRAMDVEAFKYYRVLVQVKLLPH